MNYNFDAESVHSAYSNRRKGINRNLKSQANGTESIRSEDPVLEGRGNTSIDALASSALTDSPSLKGKIRFHFILAHHTSFMTLGIGTRMKRNSTRHNKAL